MTIFNSRDTAYKTPFGAVPSGQGVHFTLRVPAAIGCKTPHMLLEKDGQKPQLLPLAPAGQEENGGGTVDVFTLELTAGEPGLYFYWFDLWVDYKKLYMGLNGEALVATEEGRKYQLTVFDGAFRTPAGVHGGVMYQIFPDRFFEGDPGKPLTYNERIYREDKRKEPYFWPDDQEGGKLTRDYYGGDLLGIEKKLPYLFVLGVNWIYLNPIFEAHSNHRYNTADYLKVDPYLGTNEDFVRLCRKAKAFGIRIILDGVFSHTGADSVYFNREGRYPTCGAWQGPQSPYRSWYQFRPDGGYESWWGFETLPTCDKGCPTFRQFITGEGGVIDTWLQMGASGFRLDVADELPDDFIADIRTAVKRNGEDNLLIGEVWEDASNKEAYGVRRRYFLGGELDGVMNYPFRTAILNYLHKFDAPEFADAVMGICENYPAQALHACHTHLSTHDTVRAITALAGEPVEGHSRNWQSGRRLTAEQYHLGIVRMQLAIVLQFTLPGVPCVYYGDEIAMQGYKDPFNRAYFDWNSPETHLIPLIMELAKLRKQCAAFATGTTRFLRAANGVVVFERQAGESRAAVAVNCSGWLASVDLLGEEVVLPVMGYAFRTAGCDTDHDDEQAVSVFARPAQGQG